MNRQSWLLSVVLWCVLVGGCIPPRRTFLPESCLVHLAVPPDLAYQRVVQAFAQLGGEVTAQNTDVRVLSGRVHNAVLLNVAMAPHATGTTVRVTGKALPNKAPVGELTEVGDYCALLTQER